MDEDAAQYIISVQDLKDYFNNRVIISRKEYNEYLKIKNLIKTNVINM